MTAAASRLSHVYPQASRVNEAGHLEIGGCDAIELAREFGTPAYVVAEDDLRARARGFIDEVSARHRDFDVLFASKAFPCTAVYRVLAEEGLACDVASGGGDAIVRLARVPHLYLVGRHLHIGSQLFELEPFRQAVRTIAELGDFPVYNLGGGLAAAYTHSQHPPAIVDYIDALVRTAHEELG